MPFNIFYHEAFKSSKVTYYATIIPLFFQNAYFSKNINFFEKYRPMRSQISIFNNIGQKLSQVKELLFT